MDQFIIVVKNDMNYCDLSDTSLPTDTINVHLLLKYIRSSLLIKGMINQTKPYITSTKINIDSVGKS